MRRTKDLRIGLLASVAAATLAMTGCQSESVPRRCVDADSKVVADDLCQSQTGPVGYGGYYPYRWYYGGGSAPFSPGSRVTGGSYTPPAGASSFSSPTPGATVHGVFGSSAGAAGAASGVGE